MHIPCQALSARVLGAQNNMLGDILSITFAIYLCSTNARDMTVTETPVLSTCVFIYGLVA